MLIDDLSSLKCGRARNISEIKVNNEPITSAVEIAEVFNGYFATIGSNLASEIQPSNTEQEFYLQPTDTIFSLEAPGAVHCMQAFEQVRRKKKALGLIEFAVNF